MPIKKVIQNKKVVAPKKPAKVVVKKVVAKKKTIAKIVKPKPKTYWQAVGRRKEAVARVWLYTAKLVEREDGDIVVNGKPYKEYFPTLNLQKIVESPLNRLRSLNRFQATVKVSGGGLSGQAGAIKHGLSRALVKFNLDFRKKLKRSGFLRRDSRMVERKHYGLNKARRAPQWSKR